jgi:GNAT superfamily N-acetyltransferase
VGRVPPDRTFEAAKRLVGASQADPDAAASRLVENARAGRIDLSLMFAAESNGQIRQVCLLAPSSGRTAALFISEPFPHGDPGGDQQALQDRAACIAAAEAHAAHHLADRVAVLQALPEPEERWSVDALRAAGFIQVGDLTYLRRPIGRQSGILGRQPPMPTWPVGVAVRPLSTFPGGLDGSIPMLCDLLDRTYVGTLDCPALCGLRDTRDVLDSHQAVGQFDPAFWFIVFKNDIPEGCMLLAKSEELRSVELVYLGLTPALRGMGVGAKLLDVALRSITRSTYEHLTCAVDRSNTPAVRIYQRAGFRPFGERAALVKPVRAASAR